jgi:hypothetical protein
MILYAYNKSRSVKKIAWKPETQREEMMAKLLKKA